MSQSEKATTKESFQQRLDRLRWKIDLLPAEQRPHLFELAEVVEQQYRRLQKRESKSNDAG